MDCLTQPALGRTAAFGDLYDVEEARFLHTREHLTFPIQAIDYVEDCQLYPQYLYMHTIRNKFIMFKVPPELQLHILGHVLEVKGSGRFLWAKKSSAKTVQVSLLCRVITKKAVLNIEHPECWKSFNLEQLAECASLNKYLVKTITFGAMVVVSVEDRNEDDRDPSKVREELFQVLVPLTKVAWHGTSVTDRDFANTGRLSWTVYSDFVENPIQCPSFHDVVIQLENVIETVKVTNGGYGIPIVYTLWSLQRCFSEGYPFHIPGCLNFTRIPRIGADVTAFFVKAFDDIFMMMREVNDLSDITRKYAVSVNKKTLYLIIILQNQCKKTYIEMWEALGNALLSTNCGIRLIDRLTELKQEIQANFGSNNSYIPEIRSHPDDVYLHYSNNAKLMHHNCLDISDASLRMLNGPSLGARLEFADNDFSESSGTNAKATICYVKDKTVISEDMFGDCMRNNETACVNPDHCTALCRKVKSSNGHPDTGRSMNLTQKSADYVTVIKTNEGLPNSSPLKQNTDFRTPLAGRSPEMIDVCSAGVIGISVEEAGGQVPKIINKPEGTSEDSRVNAAENPSSSRNNQIVSMQGRVRVDEQDKHQASVCGRMDAKNNGIQKPALQNQRIDMNVYDVKEEHISRPQQNRAEGQTMDTWSKDKPTKPNSHAVSTANEHHSVGKILSSSKSLPGKTNSTYVSNLTVILKNSGKNIDKHSGSCCKTGHDGIVCEEVQGKTDKAVKGFTERAANISTSRKPLMIQLDSSNRLTASQKESRIRSTVRSQKSAMLQTSADMPFRIDKLVDGSGLQNKVKGQSAPLLEKDKVHFQQSRQGKKTSSESSPKSKNDTFFKFPNEASLEGHLTEYSACPALCPLNSNNQQPTNLIADLLSSRCPANGQFEDSDGEARENSGKAVNILLLGESGVGKSTWINGVANYLAYATVEEAARNKPVNVINSSFLLTDDDFKEVLVSMGPGGDRKTKLGASATQTTKSYKLSAGDRTVRLIDTPGIGDTRGMDKDQENFQSIFSHLSRVPELHGICILLKPNSARMTTSFQFCLRELLAHLHRDACRNIVFVFTCSRGTFYRPGDTFSTLTGLLRENKEVDIPLDGEHVYCMDNEPVRFLAATKQGVKFSDSDKDDYSKSWDVSRAETDRLFAHVSGLEPHAVQKTLYLNDIRKANLAAAGPLLVVASNLQFQIFQAQKHDVEAQKTWTLKKLFNVKAQEPSVAERSITQLKSNQRSILQAGAKPGIFLKQNTIGVCSDVVAEQLKRGIEKIREQVARGGSRQELDALIEVLFTYKKEAGRLEEELKQKQTEIQFCEVQQSFDEFFDVWNARSKTNDHHGNRTSSKEYRRK